MSRMYINKSGRRFIICIPVIISNDRMGYYSVPVKYNSKEDLEKHFRDKVNEALEEGWEFFQFDGILFDRTDLIFYRTCDGKIFSKIDDIRYLTVDEWFNLPEEEFRSYERY